MFFPVFVSSLSPFASKLWLYKEKNMGERGTRIEQKEVIQRKAAAFFEAYVSTCLANSHDIIMTIQQYNTTIKITMFCILFQINVLVLFFLLFLFTILLAL